VALVPARGLIAYMTWEMREAARAEALQDAMRLARVASSATERLVDGSHQLLTALARLPEIRSQQGRPCSALFADLLKPYPYYSNLAEALDDMAADLAARDAAGARPAQRATETGKRRESTEAGQR